MPLNPELVAILVCPKCKGDLQVEKDPQGEETAFLCNACRLKYKVEDGIPVMLIDAAEKF